MTRTEFAVDQIVFARRYTLGLLEELDPHDWFRIPSAGISHIAWQVGHLAMAQYRLALERIRGRMPDDPQLIADDFLALFGRGSVPQEDPSRYPSMEEILHVFDRVHARLLEELPLVGESDFDLPPHRPHKFCTSRLQAMMWCSQHEMLHAGQIGLLRRQLGISPLW